MHLVFSDLHLGRSKAKDADLVEKLVECIESYGEDLQEVILLGDVFDSYMDYPQSPDPNIVLLEPAIRSLLAQGISVSYHVGNHDPWHLNYFQKELSIDVHRQPQTRTLNDRRIYFSHGDEEDARGLRARMGRYVMRTPFYYWLYRTFIPISFGQKLPKLISRRYALDEIKSETVDSLARSARRILEAPHIDVVIFGHSHCQSTHSDSTGSYFNTGSWFEDLSYLEIWPSTIDTKRWKRDETRLESDRRSMRHDYETKNI